MRHNKNNKRQPPCRGAITYERYPTLKWLSKADDAYIYFLNGDAGDEKLRAAIDNLESIRADIRSEIHGNIFILSDSFRDAVMSCHKNFTGVGFDLCAEGIEPHTGCFMVRDYNKFVGRDVTLSFIYRLTPHGLDVHQLQDGDKLTIYAKINLDERRCGGVVAPSIVNANPGLYFNHHIYAPLLLTRSFLLFKHFAKIEASKLYPRQGKRNARGEVVERNDTALPVKTMTSRWFTECHRDEDFAVRGHFRLQPKKNEKGEWTKELIYINDFVKHGYHRAAQITRQQAI